MEQKTTVIYNAECPICSREIQAYERYAEARALPLGFDALDRGALDAFGIDRDTAARRLHVLKDGEVLSGVPAFAALWTEMPRFRWAGWLVMQPVIRPVVNVLYEGVLAPALYALHKRRQRRASTA
ncbi:MAG: DUF393 domain-containing protein [Pseudomonadota bacterium]